MTHYGAQEGAKRGYNPAKRGRASHHPLMAFVADTRMIANCWLRPGNTSSSHNVQGFLDNTLHRLGQTRVALLRADSGFCDSAFFELFADDPIIGKWRFSALVSDLDLPALSVWR